MLLQSVLLQTPNITSQHYLAYAWLWSRVCIWGADILWECFQALVSHSSLNYPVVRHWSGSDKIIVRLLWSSCSQWTFWSLLAASCLAIWDSVWKRSKTLMHSKCWWIFSLFTRIWNRPGWGSSLQGDTDSSFYYPVPTFETKDVYSKAQAAILSSHRKSVWWSGKIVEFGCGNPRLKSWLSYGVYWVTLGAVPGWQGCRW